MKITLDKMHSSELCLARKEKTNKKTGRKQKWEDT